MIWLLLLPSTIFRHGFDILLRAGLWLRPLYYLFGWRLNGVDVWVRVESHYHD